MDDADKKPEDKIRHTLTFTHKQVGVTATVASVLLALQPTLNHFQSKDVSAAQMEIVNTKIDSHTEQMSDLKTAVHDVNSNITAMRSELVETLRRVSDSTKDREKQAEARQHETDVRQDRHIEALEANRNTPGRHSTTN